MASSQQLPKAIYDFLLQSGVPQNAVEEMIDGRTTTLEAYVDRVLENHILDEYDGECLYITDLMIMGDEEEKQNLANEIGQGINVKMLNAWWGRHGPERVPDSLRGLIWKGLVRAGLAIDETPLEETPEGKSVDPVCQSRHDQQADELPETAAAQEPEPEPEPEPRAAEPARVRDERSMSPPPWPLAPGIANPWMKALQPCAAPSVSAGV